jgi:hypothetical protein
VHHPDRERLGAFFHTTQGAGRIRQPTLEDIITPAPVHEIAHIAGIKALIFSRAKTWENRLVSGLSQGESGGLLVPDQIEPCIYSDTSEPTLPRFFFQKRHSHAGALDGSLVQHASGHAQAEDALA